MKTPRDFGLPFESFYRIGIIHRNGERLSIPNPTQLDLVNLVSRSNSRFVAIQAPTGSGKTVIWATLARLLDVRTVALVGTKGLQDQNLSSLGSLVADLRGRANYTCPEYGTCARRSAEDSEPCSAEISGFCPMRRALSIAQRSKIVLTNYAMWLSSRPDELSGFGLLAIDEAHGIHDHLCNHLNVSLDFGALSRSGVNPDHHDDGKAWALYAIEKLRSTLKNLPPRDERRIEITQISADLGKVVALYTSLDPSDIIADIVRVNGIGTMRFRVVWARGLAEKSLFRNIPRVVFMSATLPPGILTSLGIDSEDVDYFSVDSTFQIARRKITLFLGHKTQQVRMGYNTTDRELSILTTRMDQFLALRLGFKGIIPSVSYDLGARIANLSKFSACMILGNSGTSTQLDIDKFRLSSAPSILVHPAIREGLSFDDSQCRFIVIAKLPFPKSHGDPVMTARIKSDPEHRNILTSIALDQSIGRGNRSALDWCTMVVLDAHITWFIKHVSQHFRSAVDKTGNIRLSQLELDALESEEE